MKFKVIGQNRDTGARQILEFEAESKGAAERKARQAGMTVNRVEDVTDGEAFHAGVTPGGSMRSRGGGGLMKKIVILAILLAAAYILWKSGIVTPKR